MSAGSRAGDVLGDVLVSARDLVEYRAMFGLDELPARLLDCPGGAGSFAVEATAEGADAVAADPAYAQPSGLTAHVRREVERGDAYVSLST